MLIVSPSALRHKTLTRIDNGIDVAIITVLFQFPKNNKIMNAVRQAAISASRSTPKIDALTKSDWSNSIAKCNPSGIDPA